jgi:hypothetical protein
MAFGVYGCLKNWRLATGAGAGHCREMWRRIIQALAVLSFLAGAVGWITLPDDAALWPKRLRPLIMAIGREDIIIALFALSAIGFGWTIFAPILAEWLVRRRTPPLSIHFPSIANSPLYVTRFRQTRAVWGHLGADLTPLVFPSLHRFYIGVRNNTNSTIRNVTVTVRYAGLPGLIRPPDIHLIDHAEKSSRLDIAPEQTVRFFLGQVVRAEPTEFGDDNPSIMETEEKLWRQYIMAEQHHFYGLIVPHANGNQPLLRNDGTILTLAVHADEVRPAYAVVRLDMENEIRVTLWQTRRELTNWPRKRDIVRTPELY